MLFSWTQAVDDLLRAPQRLLMGLVRAYQLLFSAWLGNSCRYEPSCSAYMMQALQRHGALAGSALGTRRLLRCYPGCPGGCDPVPERLAAWAPGWLTRAAAETPLSHSTSSCEIKKS
ncbi:MAG: hypothetical protein RLZZ598_1102 [Pseudomonadota bacterium]|jgi:uncharacterized protein